MVSRRRFLANTLKTAAALPLWYRLSGVQAHAQMAGSSYKAIVCVGLSGGNDANNMIVPLNGPEYLEYANIRQGLAAQQQYLQPLNSAAYANPLALHQALGNTAALFNSGKMSIVANVGPLARPITKAQALASPSLLPPSLLSHPAGVTQWESASTDPSPATGWGGRIADALIGQSGSLPMVLDAGPASIFTVGNQVQGICVKGGAVPSITPISSAMQTAMLELSLQNSSSSNHLVSQAAQLRAAAGKQQVLIAQAQSAGTPLKTVFPTTVFGTSLQTIAQIINGRSTIGASRQIFYTQQGHYDMHSAQLPMQYDNFYEFDAGIGAFMAALAEMGLADQVLITTHSDFNRTMQPNDTGGTDHAWGSHQMIFGGGIKGGKIIGQLPEIALGGAHDLNGLGVWIPDFSVTQMAAGVGSWMGLNATQLSGVFPELQNFSQGMISL